jgi:hypothetical protein
MKVYWGREVQLYAFVTSALGGSEWSSSCTGCCIPGKENLCLLNGQMGGPQGHVGQFGEEKNLLLFPGITPQFLGHPAHNLVTVLTTSLHTALSFLRR